MPAFLDMASVPVKKFSVAAIAVGILLSGCATQPMKASEAAPVPSRYLLQSYSKFATQGADMAHVVIVKDRGFTGVVRTKILVNGEPVVLIGDGERVELFLPRGDYILGEVPALNMGDFTVREFSLAFREPKTYYVRHTTTQTGETVMGLSALLQ